MMTTHLGAHPQQQARNPNHPHATGPLPARRRRPSAAGGSLLRTEPNRRCRMGGPRRLGGRPNQSEPAATRAAAHAAVGPVAAGDRIAPRPEISRSELPDADMRRPNPHDAAGRATVLQPARVRRPRLPAHTPCLCVCVCVCVCPYLGVNTDRPGQQSIPRPLRRSAATPPIRIPQPVCGRPRGNTHRTTGDGPCASKAIARQPGVAPAPAAWVGRFYPCWALRVQLPADPEPEAAPHRNARPLLRRHTHTLAINFYDR